VRSVVFGGKRNSSTDMLVCRLRLQRISAWTEIAS
jgi:hypothetical protein